MYRIAKFEKVSFEQFEKDWLKNFPQTEDVRAVYDSIKLPKRATTGSAGYDFYAPANVCFEKGKSTLVPTGIRSKIDEGWVLSIYPRSGLGFKHRCQLDNTVGIIDSDYYNSSNEGHIMIKISCDAHDDSHKAKFWQAMDLPRVFLLNSASLLMMIQTEFATVASAVQPKVNNDFQRHIK